MMTAALLDGVELDQRGPLADLAQALRTRPTTSLLRWRDGGMTVREFASAAHRASGALHALGVRPGDRVAIMARNSADLLACQYGVWMLGACEVSVNFELRGQMLTHVLVDCDPAVVVAAAEFLELVQAAAPQLRTVTLAQLGADGEGGEVGADDLADPPPPNALASILYTSGTTGPSKGVMIPHGYFSNFAAVLGSVLALGPNDTGYFTMPFFHVDAHIALPMCLRTGAVLAFAERFSVSRFWQDVVDFGVTWFGAVGSMLSALMSAGDPPADALTRIRLIMAAPIPAAAYEFFEDRCGVPLLQMYGQTEANGPIYSTIDRRKRGAAGWPCAGFDIRVVDRHGAEVAVGQRGELTIRPRASNMLTQGYWRRPEATVTAFADLWFHTGDLVSLDEEGFVTYHGRLTDSLRRRGENVSAFELETIGRSAPGVHECAAVAVVDELGGEDDIKVLIVPEDGAEFDPAAFFAYCERELPRFAVPRYAEVIDADQLVRGPGTGAVYKHLLPVGITERTVDRERLGK